MAEHLDQYENGCATGNLAHEPAKFRRWVNEGFKPEFPIANNGPTTRIRSS